LFADDASSLGIEQLTVDTIEGVGLISSGRNSTGHDLELVSVGIGKEEIAARLVPEGSFGPCESGLQLGGRARINDIGKCLARNEGGQSHRQN